MITFNKAMRQLTRERQRRQDEGEQVKNATYYLNDLKVFYKIITCEVKK